MLSTSTRNILILYISEEIIDDDFQNIRILEFALPSPKPEFIARSELKLKGRIKHLDSHLVY